MIREGELVRCTGLAGVKRLQVEPALRLTRERAVLSGGARERIAEGLAAADAESGSSRLRRWWRRRGIPAVDHPEEDDDDRLRELALVRLSANAAQI